MSQNIVIVIGLTPQGLSMLRTLDRGGSHVVAFCMSRHNVGYHSRYGEKVIFTDAADLKQKVEALIDRIGYRPLCYITSGELLALVLREYPKLYEHCQVVSGPYNVIEQLAHKDRMYKIAVDKGFRVAPYKTLDQFRCGDFPFPVFLKRNYEIPLFFKALRVDNEEDFNVLCKKIQPQQKKDILVQSFIDIPQNQLVEISAQFFFSQGIAKGTLIGEQRRKLKKGITAFLVQLQSDELTNHISSLCSAFMHDLKYTGFAEFEFMYNDKTKELFFNEVNTRTCGEQSAMAHKFSNLYDAIIRPFDAPELIIRKKQLQWMNIQRDVRARIEKHDFSHPLDIFRSSFDILDCHDLRPFFMQFL